MFKCEITGKFSKPGDKAIRLVTQRRERFYFEVKGRQEEESDEPIGSETFACYPQKLNGSITLAGTNPKNSSCIAPVAQ